MEPSTSPKVTAPIRTPQTPIDRGRRPPQLILPNVNLQQRINTPNSPYPASIISKTSSRHPYLYTQKKLQFVTGGLRGFAKSGLSIGEKVTLWLYNKLYALSRRWFTHFFLSIVLIIYTVGGALIFITIEGTDEDIVVEDIRKARFDLVWELKNYSDDLLKRTSLGEWEGAAAKRLELYEKFIIDAYKNKTLIVMNDGPKLWSFFNAVVYCGTIYTTIDTGVCRSIYKFSLVIMNTLQTSSEFVENLSVEKSVDLDLNKLNAFITQEQLLSDTVARKRRNLSKKHANRPPRDPTPGRDVLNTSTDDEVEKRPKTPERRRRKLKSDSFRLHNDDKQNDHNKRDSIVSTTQAEVLALFNKAKRSLTKKKEIRSQSVPSQFELDLNIFEVQQQQFEAAETPQPKDYTSISKKRIEKKKRLASPKIIEVLDPKTSKVIKKISKGVIDVPITFWGLLSLPRHLTIKEILLSYNAFKKEKPREWEKIKRLRNKCVTNLILIIIMCGLGGIMFKYIEGAFENFYKCGVKRVKRDFIDTLWYRSHNMREEEWKSLARNKLRIFEEELHMAHEAGMHSYSGQRSWSFLNGVIYCLTVITTIGYGHIVPTTNTGMALSIVYAIIGIPLFLLALTDFGKLFTRGIKFVWSFVRRLYYTGSCRKVRKTAHVQDFLHGAQMVYNIARLRKTSLFSPEQEDPENQKSPDTITSTTPTTPALSNFEIDDEFNLPISVAIFILVLYIFSGAVMYCFWEQWNFFAAFYFVFISLSTIGFGDYVPRDPYCMMVSVIYLVFGLALMSMCINVVQVKLSDTFSDASNKLGATIGLSVNEDDGSIDTVTPPPVEVPSVHEVQTDAENENKKEINGKKSNGKKEKKGNIKVVSIETKENDINEEDTKKSVDDTTC